MAVSFPQSIHSPRSSLTSDVVEGVEGFVKSVHEQFEGKSEFLNLTKSLGFGLGMHAAGGAIGSVVGNLVCPGLGGTAGAVIGASIFDGFGVAFMSPYLENGDIDWAQVGATVVVGMMMGGVGFMSTQTAVLRNPILRPFILGAKLFVPPGEAVTPWMKIAKVAGVPALSIIHGIALRSVEAALSEKKDFTYALDQHRMAFDVAVGSLFAGIGKVIGERFHTKLPKRNEEIEFVLVHNPKAGHKLAETSAKSFALYAQENNYTVHALGTVRDHAERIAAISAQISQVKASGKQVVVLAFGGDGTTNDVATAVMHSMGITAKEALKMPLEQLAGRMKNSGIVIGSIPIGSANDIAKNYGVKPYVDEILALVEKGSTAPLFVGAAHLESPRSIERSDVFFTHTLALGCTAMPYNKIKGGGSGRWWKRTAMLIQEGFRVSTVGMRDQYPLSINRQSRGDYTDVIFTPLKKAASSVINASHLPESGGLAGMMFPHVRLDRLLTFLGKARTRGLEENERLVVNLGKTMTVNFTPGRYAQANGDGVGEMVQSLHVRSLPALDFLVAP